MRSEPGCPITHASASVPSSEVITCNSDSSAPTLRSRTQTKGQGMTSVTKTLAAAMTGIVLAAGALFGTAAPANAAQCPAESSPKIRGAEAHWKQRCVKESSDYLIIDGWVEDTLMDGRCAYVTADPYFDSPSRTATACNSGVRKNFHWEFRGEYGADVKLRVA